MPRGIFSAFFKTHIKDLVAMLHKLSNILDINYTVKIEDTALIINFGECYCCVGQYGIKIMPYKVVTETRVLISWSCDGEMAPHKDGIPDHIAVRCLMHNICGKTGIFPFECKLHDPTLIDDRGKYALVFYIMLTYFHQFYEIGSRYYGEFEMDIAFSMIVHNLVNLNRIFMATIDDDDLLLIELPPSRRLLYHRLRILGRLLYSLPHSDDIFYKIRHKLAKTRIFKYLPFHGKSMIISSGYTLFRQNSIQLLFNTLHFKKKALKLSSWFTFYQEYCKKMECSFLKYLKDAQIDKIVTPMYRAIFANL